MRTLPLVTSLGAFARSRSGVSALEFALILPIMVVLYLGSVEIGSALTINRKVTHLTSSVADLVTQAKTLSDTDIDNIFDAAAAIIAPYNAGLLQIKVSEIYVDDDGVAKVKWSDARNATADAFNTIVTLPTAVNVDDTYIVKAEIHYPYTPAIGYVITGTFDLGDTFYLRPRLVDCVKRTGTGAYACPSPP
jgi:Flp pilus assembly protein TadG